MERNTHMVAVQSTPRMPMTLRGVDVVIHFTYCPPDIRGDGKREGNYCVVESVMHNGDDILSVLCESVVTDIDEQLEKTQC